MKDYRMKSDTLRSKYINRWLIGREVLDIGSKEGNLHKMLRKNNQNKSFLTLDYSNADLNFDLDKNPNLEKKFDCIIAGEVVEHLKSPINFISFCKRHLKKRGRIILTTPNATGLQYLLDPGWCVYYKNYRGHTQAFTLEMLKRILEDQEFKIIYCGYINAFWINNPLQCFSFIIKRLRPDLIVVADKNEPPNRSKLRGIYVNSNKFN